MGWRVPLKTAIVAVFGFAIISVLLIGFLLERSIALQDDQLQNDFKLVDEKPGKNVRAMLLGSIYEPGSNMTVYGVCLDANGALIPTANGTFTAWYPDGTVMTGPAVSMIPMNNTGRFRIHVTMGSTIGTYLTEFTCHVNGEYALAYNEWQNPEWVQKIGQTLSTVQGMNLSINSNMSTIINLLQSINASNTTIVLNQSMQEAVLEVYNLIKELRQAAWIIDDRNPTYNVTSSNYTWVAVDMASKDSAWAVARYEDYIVFNGSNWTTSSITNVSWKGVSLLDSSMPYAWMVGHVGEPGGLVEISFINGTNSTRTPIYSENGGDVKTINGTNATTFVDVKIFRRPNDPANAFYAYILGNDGSLWFSDSQGANWTNVLNLPTGGDGRISNVVANLDGRIGYRAAVVNRGGSFAYFNGTGFVQQSVNTSLVDVSLAKDGLGYLVGIDNGTMVVYRFEGGVVSEVYRTTADVEPAGIVAHTANDVWIATNDPAVYYHFDGLTWKYQAFPYGLNTGVTLSFGDPIGPLGLHDVSMPNAGIGAAVGDNGLIMRYKGFEEVSGGDVDLTGVYQNLSAIYNSTIDIQNNVTYVQQYQSTVLLPALNSILAYLGILDQKLNTTIEIVNATQQNVSVLVQYAERPRVWTTQ